MKTLQVRLGDRSYPIWIGKGIRHDDGLWREAIATGKVAIVTNASVGPLYAAPISERLKALGHDVSEISLPDGEQYKDWEHLNRIFDGLMQSRFERNDTLVALGGGVIGDMAGFAAACYQRGMRFVQVPTTLLAQVDSSVGGKTAINHPLGKNMIGAFYQPQAVLMDLDFLKTLPDREFAAGLAEIIKYGCIDDAEFFKWLEDHMDDLRAHSADALSYAIQRSCEIKADIVAKDERESGLRAILNFGHTFGHAIEAGTGYGQWLHGEAVGCGMVMAAELSGQAGGLGAQEIQRIRRLVERAGLPLVPPAWTPSEYLSWMSHDKKTRAGKIRYVVLRALGKADLQAIDDATVARLLEKVIARPA